MVWSLGCLVRNHVTNDFKILQIHACALGSCWYCNLSADHENHSCTCPASRKALKNFSLLTRVDLYFGRLADPISKTRARPSWAQLGVHQSGSSQWQTADKSTLITVTPTRRSQNMCGKSWPDKTLKTLKHRNMASLTTSGQKLDDIRISQWYLWSVAITDCQTDILPENLWAQSSIVSNLASRKLKMTSLESTVSHR